MSSETGATPDKGPSGPSAPTVKRLFARSGNRCAFPQCPTEIVRGKTVVGEICHIRGKKPDAPRYDSAQTSLQRHDYDNLILLCRIHHTIIDDDPEAYTVDRLLKMKLEHEELATQTSEAEAEHASVLLFGGSVASMNQAGGITAHTININLNQLPSPEQRTPSVGLFSPGILRDYTFVSGGGEQIARTRSQGKDGNTNDVVYWHSGPTAWLRVIPSTAKAYARAELQRLLERATVPLRPFGSGSSSPNYSNGRGIVTIGFDGDLPETIAMRITQAFRTGEIWGNNKELIVPLSESTTTCRIRWATLKQEFEQTLANYIQFASQTFQLEFPITIVAGLALVKDAEFIRDKHIWSAHPPRVTRCLEQFVSWNSTVTDSAASSEQLLEPFYKALFDACALDYVEESRGHTWPR